MNHDLLGLKAEQVSGDQRNYRFGAGPEILSAATDLYAAIGTDLSFRFGATTTATPSGAGTADAGFDGAGGAARLLVFFLPAELFGTEPVFLLTDRQGIIFDPQLDGIDIHLNRKFIHDGFHAEGSRGMTRSAKRASRAGVDRDA